MRGNAATVDVGYENNRTCLNLVLRSGDATSAHGKARSIILDGIAVWGSMLCPCTSICSTTNDRQEEVDRKLSSG